MGITMLMAQNRTVTGSVISEEDGEPVKVDVPADKICGRARSNVLKVDTSGIGSEDGDIIFYNSVNLDDTKAGTLDEGVLIVFIYDENTGMFNLGRRKQPDGEDTAGLRGGVFFSNSATDSISGNAEKDPDEQVGDAGD